MSKFFSCLKKAEKEKKAAASRSIQSPFQSDGVSERTTIANKTPQPQKQAALEHSTASPNGAPTHRGAFFAHRTGELAKETVDQLMGNNATGAMLNNFLHTLTS